MQFLPAEGADSTMGSAFLDQRPLDGDIWKSFQDIAIGSKKEHHMWVVERSDSQHRSAWATGRDAKHYISCLGLVSPIAPYIFDVWLSSGKHITASMVRN
jgi:hypothetical protein